MNVPYDTGKVKIGLYYQHKQKYEYDKDMAYLQTCLLRKKRHINWFGIFYFGLFMVFLCSLCLVN